MSLSKAALNMAEALRPVLVKLIPQKMLSAVKAKVIEKGAKDLEKTEITPFEPQAHKKGINLIGSIKSDTGLGQSMRLVAEILENSTWDYTVYDYFVPPGGSRTNEAFDGKITQTGPYNINLIHVNPSELPLAFMDVGKNQWDTRYNIGYWLWELEEFPKEWLPAFHLLDEVWTPSEFISQNLRKYTDKPVYTLPYSVTAPADAAYVPAGVGRYAADLWNGAGDSHRGGGARAPLQPDALCHAVPVSHGSGAGDGGLSGICLHRRTGGTFFLSHLYA